MFDVVMPVTRGHNSIAGLSIQALVRHFRPRHIYILTSIDNFAFFEKLPKEIPFVLLDEDRVIPGVKLQLLGDFIENAGQKRARAGWYFQQFLKMSACFLPDISDYYLIWDADTLMLKPIAFLNDRNQTLIKPSSEYHQPYFETYQKLIGYPRRVDFSFISEHFLIRTAYMRELISVIEDRSQPSRPWVWSIMNAVEPAHLSGAGFSEYETYGNFVHTVHPDALALRPMKTLRYGARMFGPTPNRYDLYRLSLSYAYASFESWDAAKPWRIKSEKLWSALIYYLYPGRYLRG